MEGNTVELPREEYQEANEEELMLNKNSLIIQTPKIETDDKNINYLSKEQETLKSRLEELKKENFSLQASINAWQLTLSTKLDEFKEADFKLNEIYNEIWSEREKFCSRADEFDSEYGILSEWWERQMEFIADLENLENKRLQDKKCQQEIEKLEKEVEDLKKELELQAGKQAAEGDALVTDSGDCPRNSESEKSVLPKQQNEKKVKFLEINDETDTCKEKTSAPSSHDLFSLVDLEKVRKANRIKHRRCRSHFLTRAKKLLI